MTPNPLNARITLKVYPPEPPEERGVPLHLLHRSILIFVVLALALSLSPIPFARVARTSGFAALDPQEKDALSELFGMMLIMERSAERKEALEAETAVLKDEIGSLEGVLKDTEVRYAEARAQTSASLRWLHRMGPTSYLEVLLGATTLREFLTRMDLVVTAIRGTLRALSEIQLERRSLSSLREDLATKSARLEALADEADDLARIHRSFQDRQDELAPLFGSQAKKRYEELTDLLTYWNREVEPYLDALPAHLANFAKEAPMPEGIKIVPSLFSVKVIVPASSLNDLLLGIESLLGAMLLLDPGETLLSVPKLMLALKGTLSLDTQGRVLYRISGIEFAEMNLSQEVVRAPLDDLYLDLGPGLQGMVPRGLVVKHDTLELTVSLASK